MFNSYTNKLTGTGGGPYEVAKIVNLPQGKVAIGFKDLGGNTFRVRVEPANVKMSFNSNWTTPSGSQNRFSTVVSGTANLAAAVVYATKQVTTSGVETASEVVAKALKAAGL